MRRILSILGALWRYVVVPVLTACFAVPIHGRCRFTPSCSDYALQAVDRHGVLRAIPMIVRRIGRCHPWGAQGEDPVRDSQGRGGHG